MLKTIPVTLTDRNNVVELLYWIRNMNEDVLNDNLVGMDLDDADLWLDKYTLWKKASFNIVRETSGNMVSVYHVDVIDEPGYDLYKLVVEMEGGRNVVKRVIHIPR